MKNNRKRAFTLIELLVVIAIIAILAAILFPVFAQAKVAAKKAVMVSNEKQIVLGMIMYSNDSDDMFPQGETGDSYGTGHPHVTWSTMIYPYVKNGDQDIDPQSGQPVCTAKGGLFRDPAAPQIDLNSVGNEGYYEGPNDLICPANYQGGETWFTGQEVVPLAQTQLATPADTVLLSEKGTSPTGPWSLPWLFDGQTSYIGAIANNPGHPEDGVKFDGNTSMTPGSNVYSPVVDTDCTAADVSANLTDDCAGMPRYRYSGSTVMSYGDGHTKAVNRSALKWFKNIYIQRSDITSSNWVYGQYYPVEPL